MVPNTQMRLVKIGPEKARQMLETTLSNRRISDRTVKQYRSDMAEGRWHDTGDPIRFDRDGHLIDGQHRLTAVSQMPDDFYIIVPVITGLDPMVQKYMDQGRKRQAGQNLQIAGFKNANRLAAAARVYIHWKGGQLYRSSATTITAPKIQDWVESHPEFASYITANHTALTNMGVSFPHAAAVLYDMHTIDPDMAADFLSDLTNGASLPVGDPVLTFRNTYAAHLRRNAKVDPRDYMGLLITAWNCTREGRRITKFWRTTFNEDTFPVAK